MSGHPRGKGSGRPRGGGHEEEGGSERWLVTYADMLTLLLVLFIVLFSISVVNTTKFISLKTSLASAFGSGQKSVLGGGNGLLENSAEGQGQTLILPGAPAAGAAATQQTMPVPTSHDYSAAVNREISKYRSIQRAVNSSLSKQSMKGAVQFSIDRRGLIIKVVTNALVFPANSADLLSAGQRILNAIAPSLKARPNSIEVDGYTNQVKASTYPYPSGWELSSARASAVVRSLAAHGVAESRLSAVGYSDQRPLYPASDPRSVTRNRRVEIVVLTALPSDAAAELPVAAANVK